QQFLDVHQRSIATLAAAARAGQGSLPPTQVIERPRPPVAATPAAVMTTQSGIAASQASIGASTPQPVIAPTRPQASIAAPTSPQASTVAPTPSTTEPKPTASKR